MATAAKCRNELSLEKKVEVLKYVKDNPGVGSRKVADVFICGKTQILCILKNKDKIMRDYETNGPRDRKRHFTDVNKTVYKWYCLARQRNIPVSGPMLQEEALQIAGWLESFKKGNNIKQMSISGECSDVPEETVSGWHERLKTLMEGYKAENIWNTDETGCFYRALPQKSLADKSKECRGGKKRKNS